MDLQHIVKYDHVKLIFFAMVNKYSSDPCVPLQEGYDIFDKYGLDRVSCFIISGLTTMNDIVTKLRKLYNKVGSSTVEDEGEGNVIYFLANNPKVNRIDDNYLNKRERVITLCK